MAEQMGLPDLIARDLMPVIQTINTILLIGLPIGFFVLLAWAVVLSFRFVAPLERLEEDIKAIDEGDYSVRLAVNKDHDLAPIADVINDLVDKLERSNA
ncbi:MAG: HAMP domain-containing protein [Candidatus Omnitrophica bacterium]|nr:HAMP domain-containing protein [Candidatus Omnitrophota bacterium]